MVRSPSSGSLFGLAIVGLLLVHFLLWQLGHEASEARWDAEQEKRIRRLQRVCAGRGRLTNAEVDPTRFLYEPSSNVLWCQVSRQHRPGVPKAGSTTYVMTTYAALARKIGHEVKVQVMGDNSTKPWRPSVLYPFRILDTAMMDEIRMQKPFVFAVVRHPYERLVSSYLDFGEMTGGHNGGIAEGTFVDFLTNTVLKEAQGCTKDNACPGMNHHWKPLDSLCSFCALNFTWISKMETFSRDHHWISRRIGVGLEEAPSLHSHAGQAIRELTGRYFGQVSHRVKKKLATIYKNDFLMFGYNPLI